MKGTIKFLTISSILSLTLLVSCSEEEEFQAPDLSIQERLDQGESPLDIMNQDPSIEFDSLYGKIYEEGYIFFIDLFDEIEGCDGMVAAKEDLGRHMQYACANENSDAPDVNNSSSTEEGVDLEIGTRIGDGLSNTIAIVNSSCQHMENSAVLASYEFIGGGYNDWFLPSRGELWLMHKNLFLNNHGNFRDESYWCSTEADHIWSWALDFKIERYLLTNKDGEVSARAVRCF